jgi:hypothetical protein
MGIVVLVPQHRSVKEMKRYKGMEEEKRMRMGEREIKKRGEE